MSDDEITRLRKEIDAHLTNIATLQDRFSDCQVERDRFRTALEKITKCDDDGYGPDGYCINIAEAALAGEEKHGT